MIKRLIISLIILSAFTIACPADDDFRGELKKGLFGYLNNPSESVLTLFETKDLITVYLTTDLSTSDCSTIIGTESGLDISTILGKIRISDIEAVPRCSDGTLYGECSDSLPKFCYSGKLMEMCAGPDDIMGNSDDCGCGDYEICQSDSTCYSSLVSCIVDTDCGVDTHVGSPTCMGNKLVQYYMNFTCVGAGGPSATCDVQNTLITLEEPSTACMV